MKPRTFGLISLFLVAGSLTFYALPAPQAAAPPIPVEEIIKRFSEKEKQFKEARANYVYREVVTVETLTTNDRVTGKFEQTSEIGFDEKGKRTEKVIYAPLSTLKGLEMTKEDMRDIESIQPFVLTSDEIVKYKLTYAGQEKVDEVPCYAFDVEPKKIEKDQRYFQGKIWVDDRDFQIVKTYGKAVPDIKSKDRENLFPRFETYREQIDNKYWFPTYTRAVDTLNFSTGPVKMRQVIRYQNYKQFGATHELIFGDVVDSNGKSSTPTTATPGTSNKAPALGPKK